MCVYGRAASEVRGRLAASSDMPPVAWNRMGLVSQARPVSGQDGTDAEEYIRKGSLSPERVFEACARALIKVAR